MYIVNLKSFTFGFVLRVWPLPPESIKYQCAWQWCSKNYSQTTWSFCVQIFYDNRKFKRGNPYVHSNGKSFRPYAIGRMYKYVKYLLICDPLLFSIIVHTHIPSHYIFNVTMIPNIFMLRYHVVWNVLQKNMANLVEIVP